jgi:hypothetical protein
LRTRSTNSVPSQLVLRVGSWIGDPLLESGGTLQRGTFGAPNRSFTFQADVGGVASIHMHDNSGNERIPFIFPTITGVESRQGKERIRAISAPVNEAACTRQVRF